MTGKIKRQTILSVGYDVEIQKLQKLKLLITRMRVSTAALENNVASSRKVEYSTFPPDVHNHAH